MFDPGTATANDAGLTPLAAFLWAAGGSLALELISLSTKSKPNAQRDCPDITKASSSGWFAWA
jgi:hypothetical protein